MRAPEPAETIIHWADRLHAVDRPFASYFEDGAENPTIRPSSQCERDPLSGEVGLVIIARRRHP